MFFTMSRRHRPTHLHTSPKQTAATPGITLPPSPTPPPPAAMSRTGSASHPNSSSSPSPASAWHWPEYGAELLGTALLVLLGLSAVVLNFGSGSPVARLIPDPGWRRLLTGLMFAGSGSLVAISPLGRLSGAHINPAVSLGFWLQGKLHRIDLLGYIGAQFIGGLLGATLLAWMWGSHAASVHDGATLPASGLVIWLPILGEVVCTALLMLSIFFFVSSKRLMHWTPLMTWLLVATMVWVEAPLSGTSLNPARSFGPALVAHIWSWQWIYFLAPVLGALLAVGLYRVFKDARTDMLTAKLFHVTNYRSIFKHMQVPHMPADGPLHVAKARKGDSQ